MKSLRNIPVILLTALSQPCFAISHLDKNVTIRCIQQLLGHHPTKITAAYPYVSTQEIGTIINPLDPYHRKESGRLPIKNGSGVPLHQRDNKNKRHKGVYIQ